jgi:hypothetical protein
MNEEDLLSSGHAGCVRRSSEVCPPEAELLPTQQVAHASRLKATAARGDPGLTVHIAGPAASGPICLSCGCAATGLPRRLIGLCPSLAAHRR